MLILVGVTITVSLNGGLFETANKAATNTQKETERERLTEAALASYNVSEGKISDVDSLVGKLSGMGFSKDESKSSTSKLVVQGKDVLWQIDLNTAEVSEQLNGDIYRVAYEYINEQGITITQYLLEEGIIVVHLNNQEFCVINFKMNGRKIELASDIMSSSYEISSDGKSIQASDGSSLERNPNKKFSYNCSLDETLGIYKNAYYLNSTAKYPLCVYYNESKYKILYTFDDAGRSVDLSGITTKEELTTKLAEYNMSISSDGKEITYKGITYTLMEK